MKRAILRIFLFFGVGLTSATTLQNLRESELELYQIKKALDFNARFGLVGITDEIGKRASGFVSESHSQIYQDIFVLIVTNFKQNGFFVEFGASDGVKFSNTYLLEKKFNWYGILAEPAKKWQQSLGENRSVVLDDRCVWRESNQQIGFTETEIGELSTISSFGESDFHSKLRISGQKYDVTTVSLLDLLEQHNAPQFIDYLSIDTEGSEFEILSVFDFSKFRFGFISCEHNFTLNREKLFLLLTSNGYRRVYEQISSFDDWYVSESII